MLGKHVFVTAVYFPSICRQSVRDGGCCDTFFSSSRKSCALSGKLECSAPSRAIESVVGCRRYPYGRERARHQDSRLVLLTVRQTAAPVSQPARERLAGGCRLPPTQEAYRRTINTAIDWTQYAKRTAKALSLILTCFHVASWSLPT